MFTRVGQPTEQCHLLLSLLSFSHFSHYPQANWALWCWFLGGWACIHSRTLWISPTNSPVRLGVSPAATSTPTGFFGLGFEALFPQAETLGCMVCLTPHLFLPVYLYRNVGPPSLQSAALLVLQLLPCQESSPPTACLCPSYWSGWMFLLKLLDCPTSIQLNFLSILVVFCF